MKQTEQSNIATFYVDIDVSVHTTSGGADGAYSALGGGTVGGGPVCT